MNQDTENKGMNKVAKAKNFDEEISPLTSLQVVAAKGEHLFLQQFQRISHTLCYKALLLVYVQGQQ